MSGGVWIVLAIVVVVVVAIAAFGARLALRTRRLRRTFGTEYDHALRTGGGDRNAVEQELTERERRHAEFDLHGLPEEDKQRYTTQWAELEQSFVDDPADAVVSADRLVSVVMAERGYPVESHEQQVADLSVGHATSLAGYRSAHRVATCSAETDVSTEDRRLAFVHYRELFQELLHSGSRFE